MAIFRRGPPNMVFECRWGIGTNHDCRRITGYRSIRGVRTISATAQFIAQTATRRRVSVYLCITACSTHGYTTKRSKQNRMYLYQAVNLKRNLCSMYCTIEATNRHEASRGLSATARLVLFRFHRAQLC